MAERAVIDTGPLIALQRADALDVIGTLPIEFMSPAQVQQELNEGVQRGHAAVTAPWLRVEKVSTPLDAVALADLGAGEAAVIHLALERRIDLVVIDERKGRRAALAVGLRVTGALGLLGRAKVLGRIPAVRPFVERLRADWYDAGLLERFLGALGE